jgi:hypothetical protein
VEEKVVEALVVGLEEPQLRARIQASSINHTVLEPEGEMFTITVRVSVFKPDKKTPS